MDYGRKTFSKLSSLSGLAGLLFGLSGCATQAHWTELEVMQQRAVTAEHELTELRSTTAAAPQAPAPSTAKPTEPGATGTESLEQVADRFMSTQPAQQTQSEFSRGWDGGVESNEKMCQMKMQLAAELAAKGAYEQGYSDVLKDMYVRNGGGPGGSK